MSFVFTVGIEPVDRVSTVSAADEDDIDMPVARQKARCIYQRSHTVTAKPLQRQ